jgi:hypothetical protein
VRERQGRRKGTRAANSKRPLAYTTNDRHAPTYILMKTPRKQRETKEEKERGEKEKRREKDKHER